MDIEELSREECLRLLQYESYVGRVAFIAEGRPMILPVNYLADDKAVVFSTAPGDKLTNLREAAPVAFEVDAIRPDDLTIAVVPERLRQLGDPWATMDDEPNSLEPLLELVARDQANGLVDAPWPPVYPKMEGEPPRVAPSRAKKAR